VGAVRRALRIHYPEPVRSKPPTLVSYISRWMTLHPGNIIFTGTPGVTQRMQPGDVFEVEVEGVGVLRNPGVAEDDHPSQC